MTETPQTKLDFSPLQFHAYKLSEAFHFLTPRELFTLMTCAWSIERKRPWIVNIGAGAGTSGLAFAEARPDALIFTIDISEGGPLGGMQNERNAFAGIKLEPPQQILGDSKKIGKAWTSGPLNLVFIDGDHSSEGCHGDILAWRDHVTPGGLIILHDYSRAEWPAVYRVVNDTDALKDFEQLMIIDTLWIGRKRNVTS